MQQQQAEAAAANTPEAIARRESERRAEYEAGQREAREPLPLLARQEPVDVSPVDANMASESRLAQVVSLDAAIAAQIVAARRERPFSDWDDLMARVEALGQAQPAMFASVCGLTVNSKSLLGAPIDAGMAVAIRDKYRGGRALAR